MLDGNRVVLLTESNYSEWFSQFKLLMEKAGALLLLLDKKNVEYVYMKTDIEGDHAKSGEHQAGHLRGSERCQQLHVGPRIGALAGGEANFSLFAWAPQGDQV